MDLHFWCVLAVLLASTSCCWCDIVSTATNSSHGTTPSPSSTTHEMPPYIFPKDKASPPNSRLLKRLNQTEVAYVSYNASDNESVVKGPEYRSPGADRSAVPADTNPLHLNQYETHPGPVAAEPRAGAAEPVDARQKPASSLGRLPFLEPSKSAAILAGILAAVALLGYVGLFLWRRFLERRYGNREMLVNDDDCYDASDPKNFEL